KTGPTVAKGTKSESANKSTREPTTRYRDDRLERRGEARTYASPPPHNQRLLPGLDTCRRRGVALRLPKPVRGSEPGHEFHGGGQDHRAHSRQADPPRGREHDLPRPLR